jgi:hypothetical protein
MFDAGALDGCVLTGALFTALLELEAGVETGVVFVFETCAVGGGVGRVCETIGDDWTGTLFDEFTTFGDAGASLAETIDEERLGAGADHARGVADGSDERGICSERSVTGGAVAV